MRPHLPKSALRRLTGGVLLTALCATAQAADTETSPFVGFWSGTWENGQHNEFHVREVTSEGEVRALYCATQPDGTAFYFDIGPNAIPGSIKGKVLRFKRPKLRYKFVLTDEDTLKFSIRRSGKNTIRLVYDREEEATGCAARIAPLE